MLMPLGVHAIPSLATQANHLTHFSDSVSSTGQAIRLAQAAPDNAPDNAPDYQSILPALKTRTQVPLLLPTQFPVADKIYGSIDTANPSAYNISLDYTPSCNGAAVCTLGRISGQKLPPNFTPLTGQVVTLLHNIRGYFTQNDQEENCSTGYCFSKLTWDRDGYRYSLKLKSDARAAFIKTANSALQNSILQNSIKRQPSKHQSSKHQSSKQNAALQPKALLATSVLLTRTFKISITRHCQEGSVTCNNVSYLGQNLRTGESIRLSGRTRHTLCADGVTPCRFLGYEFRNRDYRYLVTEEGTLQVFKGDRLLQLERGTWQR